MNRKPSTNECVGTSRSIEQRRPAASRQSFLWVFEMAGLIRDIDAGRITPVCSSQAIPPAPIIEPPIVMFHVITRKSDDSTGDKRTRARTLVHEIPDLVMPLDIVYRPARRPAADPAREHLHHDRHDLASRITATGQLGLSSPRVLALAHSLQLFDPAALKNPEILGFLGRGAPPDELPPLSPDLSESPARRSLGRGFAGLLCLTAQHRDQLALEWILDGSYGAFPWIWTSTLGALDEMKDSRERHMIRASSSHDFHFPSGQVSNPLASGSPLLPSLSGANGLLGVPLSPSEPFEDLAGWQWLFSGALARLTASMRPLHEFRACEAVFPAVSNCLGVLLAVARALGPGIADEAMQLEDLIREYGPRDSFANRMIAVILGATGEKNASRHRELLASPAALDHDFAILLIKLFPDILQAEACRTRDSLLSLTAKPDLVKTLYLPRQDVHAQLLRWFVHAVPRYSAHGHRLLMAMNWLDKSLMALSRLPIHGNLAMAVREALRTLRAHATPLRKAAGNLFDRCYFLLQGLDASRSTFAGWVDPSPSPEEIEARKAAELESRAQRPRPTPVSISGVQFEDHDTRVHPIGVAPAAGEKR